MSILTHLKEKNITNRARQRTEAFNYLFDTAEDDVTPTEFYLFEYKPKYAKKLDHYDRYPMVIVGEPTKDGFYGANLHYMEARKRVNLAEKIINKNSPNIPPYLWHRYIIDKADNLFFKIPESDVLEMAVLPLEQFYDNRNKFVSAKKVQI
tara:strand:+ start:671 stop:1123 length:453 start_codon:yes stop_codon:yes gene_type:complete